MNKIKNSFLALISLMLILSMSMNIFASSSDEFKELVNKKNELFIESRNLVKEYPEYRSQIDALFQYFNLITNDDFIEPLYDTSRGQKAEFINQMAQQLDILSLNVKKIDRIIKKNPAGAPRKVIELFTHIFDLADKLVILVKQKSTSQLQEDGYGDNDKGEITAQHVAVFFTIDEQNDLNTASASVEELKATINSSYSKDMLMALNVLVSTFEVHAFFNQKIQNEFYTIYELRIIADKLRSTILVTNIEPEWMAKLRATLPRAAKILAKIQKAYLVGLMALERAVLRTITENSDKIEL